VLVYFGWPQADETDAERAVRAALAIIDAAERAPIAGERLQVRLGIATGTVVVGDLIGAGAAQEQAVIGETPNLAARLQAIALPGVAVIDGATRARLGRMFEYRDLGSIRLKGFSRPVRAWEVDGERPMHSRFEAFQTQGSPLVGREVELTSLLAHWRQARAGRGGAVLLSGEAGLGKSRLIAEVEDRLQAETATRLRYFCSPHHRDTALYPVIAALQREAGFTRGDTGEERLRKLRVALDSSVSDAADVALLAEMLSILQTDPPPILGDVSPQARRERTFEALIGRLRTLALANPLLIVLEDAHWADASTVALFGRLIPTLPELPALLIVSMRGDDGAGWAGLPGVSALQLPHLNRDEVAALAASLSNAALAPELVDRIVARTDGVPLFVEELTKTIIEASATGQADVPHLAVPASLHASLLARLDRIPLAKEVAQAGSVFGREFAHRLVAAVSGLDEAALTQGLQQLLGAGLASAAGTPSEKTYAFKHALVRDTAYGMLLRGRRRELHSRAAAALEQQSPELREQQPELLAHHYTEAGLAEPAVGYWTKAGHRSIARSSMVEAAAQLRQALAIVPDLPEGPPRLRQELELQGMLAGALFAAYTFADAQTSKAYARAEELAGVLGDTDAIITVLAGQITYHIGRGEFREARALAGKLREIAERAGTTKAQLIADRCMAICLHWTGDCAGALEYFERVLNLYDPTRDAALATVVGFDLWIQASLLSCWDLLFLGYPDRARARLQLAVSRLGEFSHKRSVALALTLGGMFWIFLRDYAHAQSVLEGALTLATEQHHANFAGTANLLLGSILATNGDATRELARARDGYATYTRTGAVLNSTFFRARLAEACNAAGAEADALAHLDQALEWAERSRERWFEPELHRLKGEWLVRHAPGSETMAKAAFACAIRKAVEQKARFWELRACSSLARLCAGRGESRRAREVLAPVCAWFSEGLDLPDLQEARALLAGLPA
jgi:predicted ATPase